LKETGNDLSNPRSRIVHVKRVKSHRNETILVNNLIFWPTVAEFYHLLHKLNDMRRYDNDNDNNDNMLMIILVVRIEGYDYVYYIYIHIVILE